MITRIVKLSFDIDKIDDFLENFHQTKNQIREFKGCKHLELLRMKDQGNVFMTYSFWDDESCLNNYRNSDLFKGIWSITKKMFSDKPEAWTLIQEEVL
ncbi:MAG: antibiotic biosynthesis monooxygenase [Flavobacteriales bacterium]|nr:antibiotic biosynthesis monooxygenase [Flavobacteriales bacterium]